MELLKQARHVSAAARRLRSGLALGAAGDDPDSVLLRSLASRFRDELDAAAAGDGSPRERRAEAAAAVGALRRDLVALRGKVAVRHASAVERARGIAQQVQRIEMSHGSPLAVLRLQRRAAMLDAMFADDPVGLREHVLRCVDAGDASEVLAASLVDGAARTAELGLAVLAGKGEFAALVDEAPKSAKLLAAVEHASASLAEIEATMVHDPDAVFDVRPATGADFIDGANSGTDLLPRLDGTVPMDVPASIRGLFELSRTDRQPEQGASTAAPAPEPTDEGAA